MNGFDMSNSINQPVHFGRETCGDMVQAERREWWQTV